MGARKKRRTRFEYLGNHYYWYVDDWRVRICSKNKRFAIAYFISDPFGEESHLEVRGREFPGIDPSEPRPVRLCVPKFVTDEWKKSMGAFVNALIRWSLRENHRLKRYELTTSSELS
ncbi:hypothetical protein [Rubinisphaera margarita]|uniref:hypothetical protein n=1 Tax=Rubinisphaera margarita TaxID=2909586 RepID=UPI001EE9110F|nr:hypothetical protein [Rubinisphaera margarita]MCG6155644.1 hypothetical protein [Rubinisphaera margarita]